MNYNLEQIGYYRLEMVTTSVITYRLELPLLQLNWFPYELSKFLGCIRKSFGFLLVLSHDHVLILSYDHGVPLAATEDYACEGTKASKLLESVILYPLHSVAHSPG
jgi:hypothetical protein